MNYFNVGVKFGGTDDMWHLFSEKNCWFMGYHENEKPVLDQQAEKVRVGDIFIAKAYGNTAQSNYYVRAIGIVESLEKPMDIPEEYKDRKGFSVIWIKYFDELIPLSASEYERGGAYTYTIHIEKNEKFIAKINEMMKYDYQGEVYI